MKILMLNYEFPPLGGGAGNANYYLLKEFAKEKNLQIDLVTSSVDTVKTEQFSKNITIHYLDIGKGNKNIHYQTNKDLLTYTLKAFFYSKKLIRQHDNNFVHAWFGIPGGLIAMLLNKPYLVALRGSDVPFYNPRFKWLDKLLFTHISRLVWKRAKEVVANSHGLKELALKTAPQQEIKVIYNGVDLKEFKPANNKKECKTLRIICVARLIERKGIKYLLQALGELKDKDFKLKIIGDGNQKESLENLARELEISNKVSFSGAVKHTDIVKYYQQSDLFVLPSLSEGMSNTVLEAMACGLPIIITDVGGARELVDEKNGIIAQPASVEELKKAIVKYMDDIELLAKHSESSRVKAEELSWSLVGKRYTRFYHSFL